MPVSLTSFSGKRLSGTSTLQWRTATEQNTSAFHVEFSRNNTGFQRAGTVKATRASNGSSYSFQHNYSAEGHLYYRLAIEEDNGKINYSTIIRLSSFDKSGIKIYPTIIQNGMLHMSTTENVKKLQLVNSSGTIVFEYKVNRTGTIAIQLPSLAKGVYIAQVVGENDVIRQKVVIQ